MQKMELSTAKGLYSNYKSTNQPSLFDVQPQRGRPSTYWSVNNLNRLLHRIRCKLVHFRPYTEQLHVGQLHRFLRQETNNHSGAGVVGDVLRDVRAVHLLRDGSVVEVRL